MPARKTHLGERLIAETQLARAENSIRRAIFEALDEHERYCRDSLKSAGLQAAAVPPDPFNESVWETTVNRVIKPVLAAVLERFVALVMKALGLDKKQERQARANIDLADFESPFVSQITSLGHITAGQIHEEINQGIAKGETTNQITRRIEDQFKIAKTDAERIVRTETHGAAEGTKLEAAQAAHKSGTRTVKYWLTVMDGRARRTHVRANGQTVDLFEDFEVGTAVGPRPGKMGQAREDINCRCGTGYRRLADDEELPPKQTDEDRDENERILNDEIKRNAKA